MAPATAATRDDRDRQFSFDVFDTAICRLIHAPEHIHLAVGRKLRDRGLVNLSEAEWMYVRAEAEFEQRRTVPHKEVTLQDIYGRLSQWLGLGSDATSGAMNAELEEELRLTRPIASTRRRVSELAGQGAPTFFLSDTYFTSKQVEALLRRCGYVPPLEIVASSEELKSKLAGTIFDHVAQRRGFDGSRFYHIGDNPVGDLQNARAKGWNAEIFLESHWTTRERVLFASGKGDFLASAIAGSARAARMGQEISTNPGILSAAASVVGPLFTAYALWVLLDTVAAGGRRIHFLARDGQVLVPICRRLAQWLRVDVDVRYTYASRQAFLLPALPDDGDEIVDQALALAFYGQTSLSDALVSLRYPENEIQRVSRDTRIGLSQVSGTLSLEDNAALRSVLCRAELLDPLCKRIRMARAATQSYLEAEGVFASPEARIVDLGWRGNTQLRLQKFLGNRVEIIGYYMGLTNSVLGPDAKVRIWTTTVPLKTGLLEVMGAADHTSVKGFGFDEDGQPVCCPRLEEDPILVPWGVRQQQAIALRFVDYVTDAIERDLYAPDDVYRALRSAGLDAYRHFRLSPTPAEAEAYGGVAHQDDVNHLRYRELAQAVTGLDVARHLVDKRARGAVSGWYMGSLARSSGRLIPMLVSTCFDQAIRLTARLRTRRRRRAARRIAQAALEGRLART